MAKAPKDAGGELMPMPSIKLSARRLGRYTLDFREKYHFYKMLHPDDPKIVDMAMLSLAKIVDYNRTHSACYSCPRKGWCHRLKWNKCLDHVSVVGCELHPDQRKFKGHSTSLNFYFDNYGQTYTGAVFATARAATDSTGNSGYGNPSIYTNKNGGNSDICRQSNAVDTQAIPDGATLTSAKYYFYLRSTNYADLDATSMGIFQDTTGARPTPWPTTVTGDYNRTYYTASEGTLAFNSMVQDAWNSITFTNTTYISKTGFTRWQCQTGLDSGNTAPVFGNNRLVIDSYIGVNRPYLQVTYDDVTATSRPIFVGMMTPWSQNRKRQVVG